MTRNALLAAPALALALLAGAASAAAPVESPFLVRDANGLPRSQCSYVDGLGYIQLCSFEYGWNGTAVAPIMVDPNSGYQGVTVEGGGQSNAGAGTTGATSVPVNGYNYIWNGSSWAQWTGAITGTFWPYTLNGDGGVPSHITGGNIGNTGFSALGSNAAALAQDAANGYAQVEPDGTLDGVVSSYTINASGTTSIDTRGASSVRIYFAGNTGSTSSFVIAAGTSPSQNTPIPYQLISSTPFGPATTAAFTGVSGMVEIRTGGARYVNIIATYSTNPVTLSVSLKRAPGDAINGVVMAGRINVTTTAAAFTGSATANAFTSALSASTSRRDCTIYSANAFTVAPGGSPASNIAIPVAAGGTFKCSDSAAVMGDQINVASATASNAYVVWSQ